MRNSDSKTEGLISKRGSTRPNAQQNQCPKTSTTANLDSNDIQYKRRCLGERTALNPYGSILALGSFLSYA